MTQAERDLRARLVALAAEEAEDMLGVVVNLIGAATAVFAALDEPDRVRAAINDVIDQAMLSVPAGRA